MKKPTNFKELLMQLDACRISMEWAGDKTIEEIVQTCDRGDWMLWLAKKVGVPLRPLTLAKGKCAETVMHLMKDERSKKAVQAAIDFGNGKINEGELKNAAYAAAAAYAAYAAAAAYAAYAAAAAAAAAADDDDDDAAAAAYAADAAAAAAAAAAADDAAAAAAARKNNRQMTSDICRQVLAGLIIELVKKMLE